MIVKAVWIDKCQFYTNLYSQLYYWIHKYIETIVLHFRDKRQANAFTHYEHCHPGLIIREKKCWPVWQINWCTRLWYIQILIKWFLAENSMHYLWFTNSSCRYIITSPIRFTSNGFHLQWKFLQNLQSLQHFTDSSRTCKLLAFNT